MEQTVRQFYCSFKEGIVIHISCKPYQKTGYQNENYKFVSVYSLLHAISILEILKSTLEKTKMSLVIVDNFAPIFTAQRIPEDPLIVEMVLQLKYIAEARLAAVVVLQAESCAFSHLVIKKEVHLTITLS